MIVGLGKYRFSSLFFLVILGDLRWHFISIKKESFSTAKKIIFQLNFRKLLFLLFRSMFQLRAEDSIIFQMFYVASFRFEIWKQFLIFN